MQCSTVPPAVSAGGAITDLEPAVEPKATEDGQTLCEESTWSDSTNERKRFQQSSFTLKVEHKLNAEVLRALNRFQAAEQRVLEEELSNERNEAALVILRHHAHLQECCA